MSDFQMRLFELLSGALHAPEFASKISAAQYLSDAPRDAVCLPSNGHESPFENVSFAARGDGNRW
jgi:hypothetical protein